MNAKEQYLRQVEKSLTVPRAKKEEILRDLQEAFNSALEHDETERDVIERLGPPAQYAASLEDPRARKQKRSRSALRIGALALLSLLSLGVCAAAHMQRLPENVIGQADSMTAIQVYGGFPVELLLLLLGIAAGVAAVILAVRHFRRRGGRGDV